MASSWYQNKPKQNRHQHHYSSSHKLLLTALLLPQTLGCTVISVYTLLSTQVKNKFFMMLIYLDMFFFKATCLEFAIKR